MGGSDFVPGQVSMQTQGRLKRDAGQECLRPLETQTDRSRSCVPSVAEESRSCKAEFPFVVGSTDTAALNRKRRIRNRSEQGSYSCVLEISPKLLMK